MQLSSRVESVRSEIPRPGETVGSRARTRDTRPGAPARGKLLPGSITVGYLLALGRGGSYIGISGILFLTDILVAAAVAKLLLTPRGRESERNRLGLLLAMLLFWSSLHMLSGPARSITGLRDAVPYGYFILTWVSFRGVRGGSPQDFARTARFLEICLLIHLSWSIVGLADPSILQRTPLLASSPEIHLLTERSDFDSACNATLAGLYLRRMIVGSAGPLRRMVALVAIATVAFAHARSGLIALAILSVLLIFRLLSNKGLASKRKLAVSAVLLIALPIAVGSLPFTLAGQRLLSGFGVATTSGVHLSAAENSQGTSTARSNAWRVTFDYSTVSYARFTLGVGFGTNYLLDSGALFELVGPTDDTSTRAPHDYYLDVLLRLGLVGLTLVGLLHFLGWRSAVRLLRSKNQSDIVLLAIGLVVTLPIVAALGVVLESPFGAVPFAWALGAVAALDAKEEYGA